MAIYHKIRQLGKGTYGTVYLAQKTDGEPGFVAVKRLYTDRTSHPGILCLRELEMVTQQRHPHLAYATRVLHESPFHGPLSPRKGYRTDKVYLEFPLADCDLEWLLEHMKMKCGPAKDAMLHITRALHYLHMRGIMHRDIKPNNVLVYIDETEKRITFKLADFGAAKPVLHREKNTPRMYYVEYRAPELLMKEERYGFGPDIWALGCMFIEILVGVGPFQAAKNTSRIDQLASIINILGLTDELSALGTHHGITLSPPKAKPKGLASTYKKITAKEFEEVGGISWKNWTELISRMLEPIPSCRANISDVLMALETVSGRTTNSSVIATTPITIRDCPCRTDALTLLKTCGLSSRWYDHCVDLINRLTYRSNHNHRHLVTAVVSIVSKYWDIELAPKLNDLLPTDVGKSFRGSRLEDYELRIITSMLEYQIYRPMLADLVNSAVPREIIIAAAESPKSNGTTVEDLAAQLSAMYSNRKE